MLIAFLDLHVQEAGGLRLLSGAGSDFIVVMHSI